MKSLREGRTGHWVESALAHFFVLLAVAFALYPVLWVLSLALSSGSDLEARVLPLPQAPSLDNLATVTGLGGEASAEAASLFGRQMLNSLLVSLATAVVGVGVAIPAAYAFARFRFVGSRGAISALLATQMFPGVASAVPLFMLLDKLGLLNTRSGLVLCYASTAVPFAIFQLRSAFEAVPKELEEAAIVDGATPFQAFVRVALPVARPAVAVTFLFAFMTAYNEFILAATMLSDEASFTLPVVLQRYIGEYDAQWSLFAAGALIVSLPVVLLFYQVQRHLVAGLGAGAVKG